MNAKQLFELTLAVMVEETPEDYSAFFLPQLNITLAECFEENQSIRNVLGKEPLERIPQILTMADEVPYEEDMLLRVLPYGVASKLYFGEDEMGRMAYLQNRYADALSSCRRIVLEQVEDVYG